MRRILSGRLSARAAARHRSTSIDASLAMDSVSKSNVISAS
jgi:hypothetical protein